MVLRKIFAEPRLNEGDYAPTTDFLNGVDFLHISYIEISCGKVLNAAKYTVLNGILPNFNSKRCQTSSC